MVNVIHAKRPLIIDRYFIGSLTLRAILYGWLPAAGYPQVSGAGQVGRPITAT